LCFRGKVNERYIGRFGGDERGAREGDERGEE
jgi:hypothetical protein